jgi:transposase
MRRSTLNKDNNSGKNMKRNSKPGQSGSAAQREPKEVLAELVEKLRKKLNPKVVGIGPATERPQCGLKPNLDGLTVGVDLGDRLSNYCILDLEGETLAEGQLRTTQEDFAEFFQSMPKARVVVEVGTHSAWTQEVIGGCGHEVVVANPRLMEGAKRRKRKNDRIDANKLARLGRVDPQSLHPMEHRSAEVRQDLVLLRARDALVAVRTELINTTRGLVKSMGQRLGKCSSRSFAGRAEEEIPIEIRESLLPLVQIADALNDCIKEYDGKIEELANQKYGHTKLLRQVKGVGPITSLAYVLTLEKAERFAKSRDVGPYLGLGAEARGFRGESTAIRNQQGRGLDGAQASGGQRAIYLGSVWAGHGLTTVWAAAMRTWWKECEETSSGGRGAQAGCITAPTVGDGRGV